MWITFVVGCTKVGPYAILYGLIWMFLITTLKIFLKSSLKWSNPIKPVNTKVGCDKMCTK